MGGGKEATKHNFIFAKRLECVIIQKVSGKKACKKWQMRIPASSFTGAVETDRSTPPYPLSLRIDSSGACLQANGKDQYKAEEQRRKSARCDLSEEETRN